MTSPVPTVFPGEAVSRTVYSVVWPETESLVRRCMKEETEAMLARHRGASTKRQDPMHEEFFEAWKGFAAGELRMPWGDFPHRYPCAGSSEAIREILRSALWHSQDLVVFDGDYEGYETLAAMQGTPVHRVTRERWRETLAEWARCGPPWAASGRRAQWWISQPSSLDGNAWPDFAEWLDAVAGWGDRLAVWVDLCYLGVTTRPVPVDLSAPHVAGVVFSLSKVMGTYYRRIGGCWSRTEQPGLWGNGWFKNIDSLYLGTRWLNEPIFRSPEWRLRLAERQTAAMTRALAPHAAAFTRAGVAWRPSDVALLVHASTDAMATFLDGDAARWWGAAARGADPSSRRLCIAPSLEEPHVAP